MDKVVEWLGSVGKIAIAIGAAIGAAIGVAALIWQAYVNKRKMQPNQMMQYQMPVMYNQNMYAGGWAY